MNQFKQTEERAREVLQENLYEVNLNGKLYRRTVPSRQFYVHQWNWDSATHAMGLVHIDEERAFDELLSLVSGQWENGLIAQIIFNPNEKKYYPGPEFWGTERFAKGDIVTSGITQPPLLAISVEYVYKVAKNRERAREFIEEIIQPVIKYHNYLKKYRDNEDCGLLTVVHPWESGTDNSPRWDKPLSKIDPADISDDIKVNVNRYRSDNKIGDAKHRPGMEDYYRYMYLVGLFMKWKWDYSIIVKKSPFAVKDILFNALWCKANQALAAALRNIGRTQEAELYADWAVQTSNAISNCWDKDLAIYTDIDVAAGSKKVIKEDTIATFIPIWAGIPDEDQLESLVTKLTDFMQYWTTYPVPTVSMKNKNLDITRYWRGPTWPITNLFIIEGLNMYLDYKDCRNLRDDLIEKTMKMVAENGFFEYFDPTKGTARPGQRIESSLGFGSFSWTAAVFLYLYHKYNLQD